CGRRRLLPSRDDGRPEQCPVPGAAPSLLSCPGRVGARPPSPLRLLLSRSAPGRRRSSETPGGKHPENVHGSWQTAPDQGPVAYTVLIYPLVWRSATTPFCPALETPAQQADPDRSLNYCQVARKKKTCASDR